jgi:hypothetical protein
LFPENKATMKPIIFLIVLCPFFVTAQQKPLLIAGAAPVFYINHTVAPKENYYSIGRLYNISPKEIAPFNSLELEKGLSLNQSIKIPLTATNFVQDHTAEADEALVPLYHTVKEKEGLYRIGTNYNKLPVATIKTWNNIKADAVANGTKIIVGFLKVKKELSALSGMAKTVPLTSATTPNPAKPTEKPIPATTIPETTATVTKDVPVEKAPVKTVPPQVTATPEPAKQIPVPTEKKEWTAGNFNKAVFKPDFEQQSKQRSAQKEIGTAAAFKSSSGWDDGKYYCLHNTAMPGTIVKVTCNSTGKTIYAKVLDSMPDIKQNTDLLLRLSNAATEELGVGENKFDCTLQYAK